MRCDFLRIATTTNYSKRVKHGSMDFYFAMYKDNSGVWASVYKLLEFRAEVVDVIITPECYTPMRCTRILRRQIRLVGIVWKLFFDYTTHWCVAYNIITRGKVSHAPKR